MQSLANIFWLTGKELKSVLGDPVMVILILWSFVVAVMLEASGAADTVQNAAIAIVDEDRSALTRQIAVALMPPWFQEPGYLNADQGAAAVGRGGSPFARGLPPP